MVNQVNPYGSLSYEQNGTWNGKPNGTPRFTATTTLSPEEMAKQQQQWKFDSLVNNLGIQQTEKLTGLLDAPVDLNNEATESRLFELGSKRLDPMLEQRRAGLETRLYNQGVMPGTEAYDRAMRQNTEGANDAYNQLLLSGRGQSVQEALTQRNQPINEITALMSGGQVSQPNFVNTPTAQVGSPDIGGMTYQSYQMGPMAQYNAQNANQQAMMGGLFGMAGAGLGGWARGGFGMPK